MHVQGGQWSGNGGVTRHKTSPILIFAFPAIGDADTKCARLTLDVDHRAWIGCRVLNLVLVCP